MNCLFRFVRSYLLDAIGSYVTSRYVKWHVMFGIIQLLQALIADMNFLCVIQTLNPTWSFNLAQLEHWWINYLNIEHEFNEIGVWIELKWNLQWLPAENYFWNVVDDLLFCFGLQMRTSARWRAHATSAASTPTALSVASALRVIVKKVTDVTPSMVTIVTG